MSCINTRYKHVFIHVPKTAGSSIESSSWVGGSSHQTLYELRAENPSFIRWGFVRDPVTRFVSAYRHYTLPRWPDNQSFFTQLLQRNNPTIDECIGLLEAHMTRHPNNLTCDLNGFKSLFDIDLAKFDGIEYSFGYLRASFPFIHFVPQHYFLCIDGTVKASFVGKFERLDIDFAHISMMICGRARQLCLHNNKSEGPDIVLTIAQKNRIREIYRRDCELWYNLPDK